MHPSALVFLQGDVKAQRLAVAWPLAYRPNSKENAIYDRWCVASGLPLSIVVRIGPSLRANGICRDDGTVDPLAQQYISAQVQKTLRKPKQ